MNEETIPAMANVVPWNECILRGQRTFKTLHFNWHYRGPVLLYNSRSEADHDCVITYKIEDEFVEPDRGLIVGVADVVDCVWDDDDGYWHVELRNPRRFAWPIQYKPTRGSIRLSRCPISLVKNAIERAER